MKTQFIFLIVFFMLTSITGFGQSEKNTSFDDFIKQFPVIILPDTIQYTDNEFDYGYYEQDMDQDAEESTGNVGSTNVVSKFQHSVLPKPDTLMISYEWVKNFLMRDTEEVTIYLPQESDTIYPGYYFTNRILTMKKFYCVIYERQYNLLNQKYLCTLSMNGSLIDKIKVASADYTGKGILKDNLLFVFYSDQKSILTKDMKIYFFTDGINHTNDKIEWYPESIYQIDSSGKIKKMVK